jgi:hypothetical protein
MGYSSLLNRWSALGRKGKKVFACHKDPTYLRLQFGDVEVQGGLSGWRRNSKPVRSFASIGMAIVPSCIFHNMHELRKYRRPLSFKEALGESTCTFPANDDGPPKRRGTCDS